MKIALLLGLFLFAAQVRASTTWASMSWHDERAFVAVASDWKAVVSAERGRLVYLGPADGSSNLLFATSAKLDPAGWGGHRVWLGPQDRWATGGWPPPAAWEAAAALHVRAEGVRLTLEMPESGGGWPQIIREYEWKEGRLLCTARIRGGSRKAQIIQILQVPSAAKVSLRASETKQAPQGYALLHLGRHPSPQLTFKPRPQVTRDGDVLRIRFNGTSEKLGVDPQTIHATVGDYRLSVARLEMSGMSAKIPDNGFVTQVYLGRSSEPMVELEQLSALSEPGRDASFGVAIEIEKPKPKP